MKVDLHIHTNFSDGLFSPREILDMADKNDFKTISITDHDTIEGNINAQKYLYKYDIKLVTGVEISSIFERNDVHILAYNFDHGNEKLNNLLLSIKKGRLKRAKEIIRKLKNLGVDIDVKKVMEAAGKNNLIGRPHIARVLVKNGNCNTTQEAFDYFLGNDSPAYVLKPAPTIQKIIETVHEANGLTVLAHPHTLFNQEKIYDIIDMGIDGLEAYYARYDERTRDFFLNIAKNNNLITTGGSDFHGDLHDFEILGDYSLPEHVVDDLDNLGFFDE